MENSALARKIPPKDVDRKRIKDFLVERHSHSWSAGQIAYRLGWFGHHGLYRARRRLSELLKDPASDICKVGDTHNSVGSRVMLVQFMRKGQS